MSKPWGGAGAWAAEAELAEQEAKEREQAYKPPGKEEAFPSLGDSLSTKPKKKNKGQTLSLSELMTGKYVGPGGKARGPVAEKLTTEELMSLPTGPRERANDEPESGGLGGGFKDYGGYRGGGDRGGDREERRDRGGFGGGFAGDRDREERGYGRDRERDDGPSRADGDDKWGASKKFVPSQPNDRGSDRGGDRGGYEEDRRGGRLSDRDLPSRADEVDNWGSGKKFVPTAPAGGDGYNDRRMSGRFEERRQSGGGFDNAPGGGLSSRADEVEDWGKGKKFIPSAAPAPRGSGGGFEFAYREAGPDADRWARKELGARETEPRVTERPRLKLAPRSVPVESPPPPVPGTSEVTEESVTVVDPTPNGEHQEAPPKPKPRSNPFGAARPREEILAEKGHDWRKIDAEFDRSNEKLGRTGSRPTSSHSNRGGGSVSSRPQTPEIGSEALAKPRVKVNPFGDAKPREVTLEEKGKDVRRTNVDLEQKSSDDSAGKESEPEAEEKEVVNEEISTEI